MGDRDWGRWQVILGSWQVVLAIIATAIALISLGFQLTPTTPDTPSETSIEIQTPTVTTGSISVSSSPVGASVYLDGNYKGEVPQFLYDIEQGTHLITLKLEGYENWSQNIIVDANKTFSISPTLSPIETSIETPIGTSVDTPIETSEGASDISNLKEEETPTSVDISPYIDWSFTISKENFYIDVPYGYSFVTVTVNVNNYGDIPISTDSSCWKLICDGTSYSCEPVTTAFSTPSQYEVSPGESLTFILHYLVKGEPTIVLLGYNSP